MSVGQSLLSEGTLASRPVTPVAWGSVYFTTDTGQAFIYNGTTATWDEIFLYTQSVTFSALPASPVTGMQYVVTDATVNTWGATVSVGGGADIVLVWWNNAAWTVIGK